MIKNVKLIVLVGLFIRGLAAAVDKDLKAWADSEGISGEAQKFDWRIALKRWVYGGVAGLCQGVAGAAWLPDTINLVGGAE